MNTSLGIYYKTVWGQELAVKLSDNTLLTMSTTDGEFWTKELSFNECISYKYCVLENGAEIRSEDDYAMRTLSAKDIKGKSKLYIDYWQDNNSLNVGYISFASKLNTVCKSQINSVVAGKAKQLVINMYCTPTLSKYRLMITGSIDELGAWNTNKAKFMDLQKEGFWSITIPLDSFNQCLEYKYLLFDIEQNKVVQWENNHNRTIDLSSFSSYDVVVKNERDVYMSLPEWKVSGVAIPLFSVRSDEHGWGVGDFSSLTTLIDWAECTNQKVVQILPINDTTRTHTWKDSYPYNAISIYAIHPMYANPYSIGLLADKDRMEYFEFERNRLNNKGFVDYEAVNVFKWEYYEEIYKQEGEKTLRSTAYKKFFNKNKEWLVPYAAFSCLRDKYGTADFTAWQEYSDFSKLSVKDLEKDRSAVFKRCKIYYFIQYHLHIQLKFATEYARKKGIVLKGDIPIGVSRHSVETWTEPKLFNMNGQAGAPPDEFATDGQNWGFPTYNWNEMSKDGYQWWKNRLSKMAEYFDAYRIDHILGFFRIWEIPTTAVHGILGRFSPALPLSVDEISHYGFSFDIRYTKPYITDEVIDSLDGVSLSQEFKNKFFDKKDDNGVYSLKPFVDTQQKVVALEDDITEDEKQVLMSLIDDVLFLEDCSAKGKYHPRISAYKTQSYAKLTDSLRESFDRLYHDFYYNRHNMFWQEQAMCKLPALISSTNMLACGEDLGMIPACVESVMNFLHILSLEIERMPKKTDREFASVSAYPYMSVCSTSTHDMSTIRGWWEENQESIQRYYNEVLHCDGIAPKSATSSVCSQIVNNHLASPSMLCILPLQDWLSISDDLPRVEAKDEQINVPANPQHYWRYRMNISTEKLMRKQELNDKISEMIKENNRI
ncbi:MAG: 4-alpha-glucanotransferase [Bacteroides sp.]|nr:4-alpha-glucanotransferase [Bacteroides sp.]